MLDQGDPRGRSMARGRGGFKWGWSRAEVMADSPRAVWASPDTVFYGTDGRITSE